MFGKNNEDDDGQKKIQDAREDNMNDICYSLTGAEETSIKMKRTS